MKWHWPDKLPKANRPFVEVYSDGSGCSLNMLLDDGRVLYQYGEAEPTVFCWAYLPPGHPFWAEGELYRREKAEAEEAA